MMHFIFSEIIVIQRNTTVKNEKKSNEFKSDLNETRRVKKSEKVHFTMLKFFTMQETLLLNILMITK